MKLKGLLLFFAGNVSKRNKKLFRIILGFTSSILFNKKANLAEQTKGISNYFPEVTYPTSLFEVNEPFYYKSHSDNVLEAFPDDVKNAYKSFGTSSIPSNKNTGKNLEDNNLLIDIAKCCAAVNNFTNYKGEKTDKICEYNKRNFTFGEMAKGSDEQINNDEKNAGLLLEEGQLTHPTNDAMAPNINNDQNYSVIPVQLIAENDVLKNDSDLFTNVPIKTLILVDDLNLLNNSIYDEEQGIITKSDTEEDKLSNINTFNELDEIVLENILSELMYDYLNNVENVSSEFKVLLPEMEEILDPYLNESTYSSFDEYSIHTVNNASLFIPVDCHEINNPTGIIIDETQLCPTEIERKFINTCKTLTEGSDSFLELIISLNQRLQNDEFQHIIHDYEERANSTEP